MTVKCRTPTIYVVTNLEQKPRRKCIDISEETESLKTSRVL